MRPIRCTARLQGFLKPGRPDLSSPFFSRVTHLGIMDDAWSDWTGFGLIPYLTHLRFYGQVSRKHKIAGLKRILIECRSLKVCIIDAAGGTGASLHELEENDDRIIRLQPEDMVDDNIGAFLTGEPDTWDLVDLRMAQKKQEVLSLHQSSTSG